MSTSITPYRSEREHKTTTARQVEAARRATFTTRIVPMKTLYLELSARRKPSDADESVASKPERHPEWYIG